MGIRRDSALASYARLAVDAVVGVTDAVESMHGTIAPRTAPIGAPPAARARGLSGFVYATVRGVTRAVGSTLDVALRALPLPEIPDTAARDTFDAALNGMFGDHLERSGNPLAMRMRLDVRGEPTGHVLVLVHGLCMTDRHWRRNGHDHGEMLAEALGCTPVYVRYNSGRSVAANGRELAGELDALVADWPVPVQRLTLLGHSMGGLVSRSACAVAEQGSMRWRRHLEDLVCLGTPHHGAPLEQAGLAVERGLRYSAYSAPIAALAAARSAGINDLREGRVAPGHLPLPQGVRCVAIAGRRSLDHGPAARRFGDGLVPVESALGLHADPQKTLRFDAERSGVVAGAGHFDLLEHRDVRERLVAGLTRGAATRTSPRVPGTARTARRR